MLSIFSRNVNFRNVVYKTAHVRDLAKISSGENSGKQIFVYVLLSFTKKDTEIYDSKATRKDI
jgi:hypothetical protein